MLQNRWTCLQNWFVRILFCIDQDSDNTSSDQSAVQRGDPEMCRIMF